MYRTRFSVHGVVFELYDPDDSTIRECVPGSSYEPGVAALLFRIFSGGKRGMFIDVGALYGYFSCYVAGIGSNVRVIAFEPNARSALTLRRNAKLNGFSNIHVHQIALGDRVEASALRGKTLIKESVGEGRSRDLLASAAVDNLPEEIVQFRADTSIWVQSLLKHAVRMSFRRPSAEVVNCLPFDGNFDDLTTRPLVVKVDVHGAEVLVLRGMQKCLKELVDVLFLEMHTDRMLVDGVHAETLQILTNASLSLFEIKNFRSERKWSVEPVRDGDFEGLRRSRNWRIQERTTMRMLMGIRRGSEYERLCS